MNNSHHHDPSLDAPGTRYGREHPVGIWLGLFGAPIAWIAQVSLSEPLAAHACYPYQTPLSKPIWEDLPTMLAAISIICLALALLSAFRVWTLWRHSKDIPSGVNKPVFDSNKGRNRFLLTLAAMSSFIFIVAIVFNICALWLISPCSSWF